MDWDLAQLRALAAIVDEGSLERAAVRLHLTPSAVSQRLKALEQARGAILVVRTRPVRPTEAGESVLRLARQIDALTAELPEEESPLGGVVRIAVNADSLATWVLPALAPLADDVRLEFHREDEGRTADLLRDGTVMGAITSRAEPIQGCAVELLGAMRYDPLVQRGLWERMGQDLARVPRLQFDDFDDLQDAQLRLLGIDPTRVRAHRVPASSQFATAVALGLGWAMIPRLQAIVDPDVIAVPGLDSVDVPLYWQRWSLRTESLDRVGAALRGAVGLTSLAQGSPGRAT